MLMHAVDDYERLAHDLVLAHDSHDQAALQRLNAHYRRAFTFDDLAAEIWRRVYAFRQRSSRVPRNYLQLRRGPDAGCTGRRIWKLGGLDRCCHDWCGAVSAYAIDTTDSSIALRRQLSDTEWDELIGVMSERHITTLDANGLMTDAVLARLAELDHVTGLALAGSRQAHRRRPRHLARMPQLQRLDLGTGALTDRGLDVLQHLPNLRSIDMTWQRGITDAGVANLRACERLERVNLMGSPTGDGAIAALAGKPASATSAVASSSPTPACGGCTIFRG